MSEVFGVSCPQVTHGRSLAPLVTGQSQRVRDRVLAGVWGREVHVINGDAAKLPEELKRRGIPKCDYILSGIPFSILPIKKKRALLEKTYEALADGGRFIIYQVTNELRQHATLFERAESQYVLQNIPPMFITVFHKTNRWNGHRRPLRAAAVFTTNNHHPA